MVCGWLILGILVLEYPWHKLILFIPLIPTAAAIFLLKGPDEEKCLSCSFIGCRRFQGLQNASEGSNSALWSREMVYHSDRDGKVEHVRRVWKREDVCNYGGMRLMLISKFDQLGRPGLSVEASHYCR